MQIWIHDNKMKKITALNNDVPDMLSYTNSAWHSYLDQATSTFDFTIPKFSNGELHEDLKLINDECFVSFYVNGSYQVFYIATLQEDDFNIQLTCNNTNLEYALEYANPFNSSSAQSIQWYLEHMDLLSFASVEIGNNEISDRKRTLTFDSQETKMNRLQSLMSNFDAEFEFKVELNRDGTYKRIVINIYQEADDTHHGIGTDRKDVVLYYSNGLKGVQVSSDKTQMFNAGVFDGKDGVNLANVEFSEKNADGVEEFYSRKGDIFVYAPLSMQRYPATMKPDGQDNWIRKDFQTEYENVNDLKAYALRTLKQYAYPLVTYTASVQSGFVSQYTDLKLGDTIRIIDKNFVDGLALEARVSEMIISFDNPANNSFVFTNYRKLDNKPSSALQTRIEQAVESKLPYRIELATTGGVTFKNNEGETIIKPSLYKGNLPWTKDVTWHWTLNSIVTDGVQYRIQARDIADTAVLTVDAFVGGNKVATTEITLTNVNDGPQGPQGPQGDEGPKGDKGDTGNGIANTVVTYGLSVSDTTEPATWSSSVPTLVKGMYLWTRTVYIYTNGESTTSYQISYIAKDADATAAINKTKQELLEKLETVRDDSLAAVEEAKQELTTVADDLSKAKTDLQNAVSAVDTKATNLKSDLSQAKQDLNRQAQQLQEQANAQSELTNRVSSVEETAIGTKTTVSELSKTVDQNGKNITSVTARTKVVEDDLSGTKTTLSQVKMTADSTSQKTATLETGLSGLSAKFDSLSVGNKNYLPASRVANRGCSNFSYSNATKSWTMTVPANSSGFGYGITFNTGGLNILLNGGETLFFGLMIKANKACSFSYDVNNALSGTTSNDNDDTSKRVHSPSNKSIPANVWTRVWFSYTAKTNVPITEYNSNFGIVNNTEPVTIEIKEVMVAKSNVPVDYQTPDAELEQKIAEYKQNADQNYASLQSTVQNLDGTVQHNKTVADQTAQGFTTRIESLETYKDGETTRANQYFELAKNETARQLSVERTAIAKDYVAKSTYTSDVTGIRNELSATTTTANTIKTNLANYQASNDKVVASLKSSLQTTDGNVSNLQTKVEAVPGQITSAVSAVEGKIPTEIGSSNLLRNTAVNADNLNLFGKSNSTISVVTKDGHQTYKIVVSANGSGVYFDGNTQYYNLIKDRPYTFSFWVLTNKDKSYSFNSLGHIQAVNQNGDIVGSDRLHQHTAPVYSTNTIKANTWTKVWCTFKATSNSYFKPYFWYLNSGDEIYIYDMMLNEGNIPLSYTPAYEDTATQISSLSSELKQTKDGITLLATKTEVNSAKAELQSGINTATNKANNAQVTANNNAQTISTHTTQISALNTGLSAKVSQSDFNTLSGRVTTAENNITAKANELSSKISSVEGKLPSGEINLVEYGRPADGYSPYGGAEYTIHGFYYNGSFKMYIIRNTATNEKVFGMNRFKVERNTEYTLYFKGFNNGSITNMDVWFLKRVNGSKNDWDSAQQLVSGRKFSVSRAEDVSVTFNTGNYDEGYLRFDNNGSMTAGTQADLYFGDVSVKKGKSNNGWSPSLAELASSQDLKTAQSEFKQTTDAIKASVTSLDKSTVKSSSLTINADGIVMKAGKSTTDVANAIGSYFAVNQNAINLFSDKINVKGSMIVSGAITGDKIAANSINSSKIVSSGITANVIKGGVLQSLNGSTNFELDTGKLFYNNNNTGVFRVQNGASTMGLKFSNTPVTVNGTSRILSRAILGGDRRETTLDDGKWDKGGFSGIVIETIKGVEPTDNEQADALRVIADNIYFTHTYSNDSLSARGWKMETYSPNTSYPSNVVLKPYGINYRNSNIVVGDVRLDNGDGSGYWMRATINTLKACFGHILNGGTSSQALNAIRSELNKISGT